MKLLKARVNNLETNLHIEIDMERLEDSSKALSFIGIEVSDALKLIPTPEEKVEVIAKEEEQKKVAQKAEVKTKKKEKVKNNILAVEEKEAEEVQNEAIQEQADNYEAETTFNAKPSFWQRFKNSKVVRAVTYVFRIKIRIELPSNALPEGRGDNN